MKKTLLQEIQEQPDSKKYIAWNGKTCYKTFGTLAWFFLKCEEYGLKIESKSYYVQTAKGNGFEFEYCEGDIIYAVDN